MSGRFTISLDGLKRAILIKRHYFNEISYNFSTALLEVRCAKLATAVLGSQPHPLENCLLFAKRDNQ